MRKTAAFLLLAVLAGAALFLWLKPGKEPAAPEAGRAVFFMIDARSNRLARVVRDLPATSGGRERAQKILDEYAAARAGGYIHPLPEGVKLRIENMAAGTVTVSVSREIDRLPPGSDSELKAAYGIVNTLLANLPDCKKVRLNVEDGRSVLRGHVDITEGLEKSEEY